MHGIVDDCAAIRWRSGPSFRGGTAETNSLNLGPGLGCPLRISPSHHPEGDVPVGLILRPCNLLACLYCGRRSRHGAHELLQGQSLSTSPCRRHCMPLYHDTDTFRAGHWILPACHNWRELEIVRRLPAWRVRELEDENKQPSRRKGALRACACGPSSDNLETVKLTRRLCSVKVQAFTYNSTT